MTRIMTDLLNDGTEYSEPFGNQYMDGCSIHLVWAETTATYLGALTLWASDIPSPGLADDADWVQMTSDHGFAGIPGGEPGGAGKDIISVAETKSLWYRVKLVRATGGGTFQGYVTTRSK